LANIIEIFTTEFSTFVHCVQKIRENLT